VNSHARLALPRRSPPAHCSLRRSCLRRAWSPRPLHGRNPPTRPAPAHDARAGRSAGRSLLIESRLTGRYLDASSTASAFRRGRSGGVARSRGGLRRGEVRAAGHRGPVEPAAAARALGAFDDLRPGARSARRLRRQGYSGSTNEVWALSLSGIPRWTKLLTSGPTPTPRAFHSAVYDSSTDRMIVFGATTAHRSTTCGPVVRGSPTWTQVFATGVPPSARVWHAAVVDRARNRMIVHGGSSTEPACPTSGRSRSAPRPRGPDHDHGHRPGRPLGARGRLRCDQRPNRRLRGLNGPARPRRACGRSRSARRPRGPRHRRRHAPSARYGASGTYDGCAGARCLRRRRRRAQHERDLALSLEGTPTWTLLPSTNSPQGRQFHTAAYDPFGDRLSSSAARRDRSSRTPGRCRCRRRGRPGFR